MGIDRSVDTGDGDEDNADADADADDLTTWPLRAAKMVYRSDVM